MEGRTSTGKLELPGESSQLNLIRKNPSCKRTRKRLPGKFFHSHSLYSASLDTVARKAD